MSYDMFGVERDDISLDEIKSKLINEDFVVYGLCWCKELDLNFIIEGGHCYHVQVQPKSIRIECVHRYDYDDVKQRYDTIQVQARYLLRHKRGLKAFRAWIQELIDNANYATDMIDERFLWLDVKNS